MGVKESLKKIGECLWEVPKTGSMNVPARLYLSKALLADVEDGAIRQVQNVAALPGIQKHALAMPDMHFGYGFPIGGVAALSVKDGGISPGGIGFDQNCGVRILRTNLTLKELQPKLKEVLELAYTTIPSGVGKKGKIRLNQGELDDVLITGAEWAVEQGYGTKNDLQNTEENGRMRSADSSNISQKARKRGAPQLGTVGAGNHFLEIQEVVDVYQEDIAKSFGLEKGMITVMIHTGSRGFGHQVCSDYLRILEKRFHDLVKKLPDRELVYAPAGTKECDEFFASMSCGANFAWCNRQIITFWVREAFQKVFGKDVGDMPLLYDVAHNIAKKEVHKVDGKDVEVYVHRKGATRAFGPDHPVVPEHYRKHGQPVLVPGDMGTASYVLVGTKKAMQDTFGSVCHGAGRLLSRHAALRRFRGEHVKNNLEKQKGIVVCSASWKTIAEEAPGVYKDIDEVVRVCEVTGISKTVAKLKPLGVIKG